MVKMQRFKDKAGGAYNYHDALMT